MRPPEGTVRADYCFAVADGRSVVIEKRADLPLIVHTFDLAKDAVEYWERIKGERLPEQKRRSVLMAGAAVEGRS